MSAYEPDGDPGVTGAEKGMGTTTPTTDEALAQRIASRGREALAERLSRAYRAAAGVHADLVTLDGERIDALARAALDRADGLQWRRSLATVAAQELGLSVGEAYSHPAVARAQALAGAPSYEQSLSELSLPATAPTAPTTAATASAPAATAPTPAATAPTALAPTPPAPAATPTPAAEPAPIPAAEDAPIPPPEPEPFPAAQDEPPAADADASAAPEAADTPDAYLTDQATQLYDVTAEFTDEPEPGEAGPDAGAIPETADPLVAQAEAPDAGVAEAHDADVTEAQGHDTAEMEAATPPVTPAPDFPMAAAPDFPAADTDLEAPDADAPAADAPAADAPGADAAGAAPALGADHFSVAAIHMGGVANLPTKREGLELRLSESGLDILHEGGEIIGRLPWDEIDSLQVPNVRARRRNHGRPRLLVRTPHGDATFEIPGFDAEELRGYVDPLVARFVHH